ncbi:MAG: SURF1 family protein [Halioglobus sp.]
MSHSPLSLQFDPEWRTTLLTLCLLPILVFLGFWQLQRADDKAALAQTWEQRRHQAPTQIGDAVGWQADTLAYMPVRLSGHFDANHYYLLDNRVYGGKFGYEVISVFTVDDQDLTVLVNRGWIAGDPARLQQPEVSTPLGPVDISGHVYVAPGKPYLLAEQTIKPEWPKTLQAVEMDKLTDSLTSLTGFPVFLYPVRIDAGLPGALSVDWQLINTSPAKHTGYAVQWFTMAVVLAIFYILRSSNMLQLLTTRRRNSTEQ